MALTTLSDDLDVIQKLDDEPNDVGGMSAEELKAKFDEAPNAIKQYINDLLIPGIEAWFSELDQAKASREELVDLALGETPEAIRAAKVEFTADDWTLQEDAGHYVLRVPQTQHNRANDAFGYQLRDSCRANSWQVVGTEVAYDEDTADIVLTSANAYDGVIVFFGV